MGTIVRYEYVGSFLDTAYIGVACLTVVFMPLGVMHWFERLVRIEEPVEHPNEFMEAFKAGRVGRD